jgi:hypothetical protein
MGCVTCNKPVVAHSEPSTFILAWMRCEDFGMYDM